jgi:signal transduction histidine kinase/HAMP domain-containing protein
MRSSAESIKRWWSGAQAFVRSIRTRIILPYIVLTVFVAAAGTYIVTALAQGSLEERLRTQMGDAAGVASDAVALFENKLLTQLRELTFLQGAYEAMEAGDLEALQALLIPSISNSGTRRTIITDLSGTVVVDIRLPEGQAEPQTGGSLTGSALNAVPLVREVLNGATDEYGDKHAGLVQVDGQLLLAIGGPFKLTSDVDTPGGKNLGVVIVAEPLQSLLNQVKETAVARRVTVYNPEGQVIATTVSENEPQLEDLSITPAFFQAVIANPARTHQADRTVLGRRVRFVYFVFLIRHQALGVMSIGIESGYISQTGAWGRVQLAAIFTVAMLAVILIGYLISRAITRPVMQLVQMALAVGKGDLTHRSGFRSKDELGTLAETFDDMTIKLDQRTTEMERLLREKRQEASLRDAILRSIGEGVLMEDQNGHILMMNPSAENMLDVLSEQFRALKPVREVETNTDARRFEIGDRVISVETSPVVMADGARLGKVLVIRDITRETEVDRLKDDFITQISHELRTPLTSIKGYSDLLLRAMGGPVADQQRSFLETINRQADTLVDMIGDLLDFTQLEAGNLGLRFEPMTMETVLRQVTTKWADSFEKKDIQFSVHIQDPIPQMLGDEQRLRRALTNLIENAYNYTLEGGQVSVSLSANDDKVTVCVQDTGVGIAPEDQAHLFSRFYRVPLERTIDVRGVGVDLYVTKAIVSGHGGEIQVESALGKGSTFTFTLPLDAGARDNKSKPTFTDLGDLLR